MRSADQLTAGTGAQGRRAQNQEREYLLQGSILDESLDILLQRLRNLCDSSEEEPITFKEHEIAYSTKDLTGNIVHIRVRHSLDSPDQPWTLAYLGNPELGDKSRPTMVRTCIDVSCTPNVCAFLQDMGFTSEFEFVATGWLFRKNRMKATVSKIHRLPNPNNLDQRIPLGRSHIVEVSTIASSSNEQVANEIFTFAEQLKPLINLEKIDHRRLGS